MAWVEPCHQPKHVQRDKGNQDVSERNRGGRGMGEVGRLTICPPHLERRPCGLTYTRVVTVRLRR